jgi:hypothetical protein
MVQLSQYNFGILAPINIDFKLANCRKFRKYDLLGSLWNIHKKKGFYTPQPLVLFTFLDKTNTLIHNHV